MEEIQELYHLFDKYEKLWVVRSPSAIRITYRDYRNMLHDYLWNVQHNKSANEKVLIKMCSEQVYLRGANSKEETRQDNEKLRVLRKTILHKYN